MNNKIGVMIDYNRGTDLRAKFQSCIDIGISSCQICIWNTSIFTDDAEAEKMALAIKESGVEVSALWAGYSGPVEWNFTEGPQTIGLVPEAYRFVRLNELKAASDFAKKLDIKNIVTHAGFIPENPSTTEFTETVAVLRSLACHLKNNSQMFLFETGQETPITLLRTIEAVGTGNLGVNLDTANPILYGKGNPLDALDVFGKYVVNTHIKDGFYPTNGMYLGCECRAGDGKANIPAIVARLNELGYTGPFTIEREISGEQQIADIIYAKKLLEDAMANA